MQEDAPEIDSDSSIEPDDMPISQRRGKWKALPKVPARARGRGKPSAAARSSHTPRPHMKNASALGAHLDDNEAINLDALKTVILRMKKPTRRERPGFTPTHPVDYMKGRHDVRVLTYDDPSKYEFFGDVRFWLRFHADWYESVILCKSHPSTEMKSINWLFFNEVNLSVIEQVNEARNNKFLHLIMEFNHDWNEEVVAQFYATLYIGRATKVMHWTLQGKPLLVTYADFTSILGY